MLSISLPMHGVGHANYYIKLAQQDYYTAQGNDPGVWFGGGAERLGLHGAVTSRAYEHLLGGRSPDGRRDLVQNAGDEQRQTAWDLTFSAPKSVSVLWALGADDVRAQIEAAHRHAVEAALSFLEETTGLTRRGKAGAQLESAALTFGLFPHFSSRASDPQVHTHALLINLAVRQDGTTGALWSKEFFRAKLAAGAVYQVQLAAELREGMGLVPKPDRIGFQVAGVPKDVCRAFSQRGETIRAVLAERNTQDARTAKQVTLDTRPHKVNVARAELTANWRTKAEPLGWTAARVRSLMHQSQMQPGSQKALEQRFLDEAARLPVDQRTPARLRGLAAHVAVELGADARMFRPLLRFVPSRPERQPHFQSGRQTATTETPSQRSRATSRPEAPGQTEAGKTAAANSHAQPAQPDAAVKEQPTATADRATSAAPRETPGRKPATMQAPGRPATATSQAEMAGQPEPGNVTEAKSHAQPSRPDAAAKAQPTSTAGRAASAAPSGPPPAAAASHPADDVGPPTRQPNAAGPEAGPARRTRDSHSQSQGAKTERQRQRTEQGRSGSQRGPKSNGQHTRQKQRRRAQPHAQTRTEQNAALLRQLDPRLATTEAARKKLYFTWKEVMATGKAHELFSTHPFTVPRRQTKQNRQFSRAFDDQVMPLPAAAQTRARLTFHATKLAAVHRADPQSLYQTLRDLRPGAERGLVSVAWRRPFPQAPRWSPVRYWKLPVVVLGHAHPKPRTWGAVLWQGSFLSIEARLQQRLLFPKAPQWSPARLWSLPTLRLGPQSPSSGKLGDAHSKPRKWGAVLWQGSFLSVEARLQQRFLFPKAPQWSPAHLWSLPALRLLPKSSSSGKSEQATSNQNQKTKDHDHSQSP